MIRLKYLFPDETSPSSYEIDYERLYAQGIRGIMFDIDNTLVEHGADATERTVELIKRLMNMGLKVCFISNNDEERCSRFNRDIGAFFVHKAGKPLKKAYITGCSEMRLSTGSCCFIGDQLFTDIYGANNAGLMSILVKQISKKEEPQIVLKRILEKPILFIYRRRRGMNNGDF